MVLREQVLEMEGDLAQGRGTAAGPAMPAPIVPDRMGTDAAGQLPAINHEAAEPSGAAVTQVPEPGRATKEAGSAEGRSAAGLALVDRAAADLLPFFLPSPGTDCS